jgi:hypothetical protein
MVTALENALSLMRRIGRSWRASFVVRPHELGLHSPVRIPIDDLDRL